MRTIQEILTLSVDQLTEDEKVARAYCIEGSELMQRPRESLTPDERAACDYWALAKTEQIPVPELVGDYVHIYQPGGETYRSVDHPLFKTGTYCDTWVSNDFSIINDGNTWHMIGITGPRLPKEIYRDEFDRNPGHGHGPELQLFHASADGKTFAEVFKRHSFSDLGNILSSCDRPGERPEIWAPYLVKRDDGFHLVYSPQRIRQRITTDFKTWAPADDLFVCNSDSARDLNSVTMTFTDFALKNWSEEKVLYTSHFKNGDPESPFLIKKDGFYYLFWCIYDGRNGAFDNRTYVFAAKTLEELYDQAPLTMLPAHAPELVRDTNGDWYLLSAYYPNNGVSAVKLEFKPRYVPKL